jgi:hypothetical protein
MQDFASPPEASLVETEAAAQRCVDHLLEEPSSKQAWENDERRVAKTSRKRAKGTTVPTYRGPLNFNLGSRDQSVFTYSVSCDAGQVSDAERVSRAAKPSASKANTKADVPAMPQDPYPSRPAFLLQPQRGVQTVPQMTRPQQRPQQHENTQGAQPKGLLQQLADRQTQRAAMLQHLQHPNERMQSMGQSWTYQQYAQQLDMYDGSGLPRGQAPVHVQYPPAGMSGMLHPDGMYCGPLGYGQNPGQVQPSEQQSAEPAVQRPGQVVACRETGSLSEASPTGTTEVRTEIDIVAAKDDEAQQFRAALRYASHPILSDAKMRSRATYRAENEQQCGSDNESMSSCVGRTPLKGERAPSPSSDCTTSTRELAPSIPLSAAGQFGPLGRVATGRCGIYA